MAALSDLKTGLKIIFYKTPIGAYPLYVFGIALLGSTLLSLPSDDGLRHVGMSALSNVTWGEVYPYSRFSDYANYNPWFGYDRVLRNIFRSLNAVGLPDITIKFIMVKTLSFVISFLAFWIIYRKSGIANAIDGKKSLTIYALITLLLLGHFFMRSSLIRPFIFGTMYLAFSFGKGGVPKAIISAGLLTFFYPYLSWFYIVPVSIAHIITGNKRFGISSLAFLILFLLFQPESFWGLQAALFESSELRRMLNMDITEFRNSLTVLSTSLFSAAFLVFLPLFFTKGRKIKYGNLLLVMYFLPSVVFVRYMIDVFMPLTFIVYGKGIYSIFLKLADHIIEKWKIFLAEVLTHYIFTNKFLLFFRDRKGESPLILRLTLILLFCFLSFLILWTNKKQIQDFSKMETALKTIPQKSILITSFNQQYQILFIRPDLRLVPSCEIAFFNHHIKEEYKNFFVSGKFYQLAKKINAKYLIEAQDMYLAPEDARTLKLISKNDKVNVWQID